MDMPTSRNLDIFSSEDVDHVTGIIFACQTEEII